MRVAIPFARWRTGLHDSFARFPLVLLASATAAGSHIYSSYLENDQAALGQCVRLAMTCALGIPLFFSLLRLRERTPSLARLPLEWLGLPPPRSGGGHSRTGRLRPRRFTSSAGFSCWRRSMLLPLVSAYLRFGESLGYWQRTILICPSKQRRSISRPTDIATHCLR